MKQVIHVDVGGLEESDPIKPLCGVVVDPWPDEFDFSPSNPHDYRHVICEDIMEAANCPECLDHPDLSIHILKFTELE